MKIATGAWLWVTDCGRGGSVSMERVWEARVKADLRRWWCPIEQHAKGGRLRAKTPKKTENHAMKAWFWAGCGLDVATGLL